MIRKRFPQVPPQEPDLREIPRWADRYARNRTLLPARIVGMVVGALLGAAITVLLTVFVSAWRGGNAMQSGLCLAAAAAILAGLAWLLFTRRLQAAVQAACNALDRGEGHVIASSSPEARRRGRPLAGLIVAVLGIMTPVIVQHLGVPTRYLQPLVALYLVPALAWLHWPKSPVGGPLMLLWPGLYALHALLSLAGVPLPAVPEPMMNVLIPLVLYGVVAIVASHIYGRFALRRLRSLAHSSEADETGSETHE
jgi:hypothetical protein